MGSGIFVSCDKKETAQVPKETNQKGTQASVQVFEIVEPVDIEDPLRLESTTELTQPTAQEVTLETMVSLVPVPDNLSPAEKQKLLQDVKGSLAEVEEYQPEFESSASTLIDQQEEVNLVMEDSPEWQQVNNSVTELNEFLLSSGSIVSRADLDQLLSLYQVRRSQINLSILSDQEKVQADNLFFEGLDAAASSIIKQLDNQSDSQSSAERALHTRLAQMMEGQL